ncbi:MAG TPA: alpha/beta hydrolase, partial [Gammaproteobacteria bacterium]|nr:alpha/beta hydrolase [Gammaproteobacteria bacterium]
MSKLSNVSRRALMRMGVAATAAPLLGRLLGASAQAQDLGPGMHRVGEEGGRDAAALFAGKNLPGGGQTEIRINQSIYTSDPHELEVAQRLRPFDPESWYQEWHRVAEANERIADGYAEAGLDVSAHEFYLRAFRFNRNKITYQPDSDPRMLPGLSRMKETFDKAWALVPPPFERVTVRVDGHDLPGYFRKPRGAAGTRYPTVFCCQGADSFAESTILGNAAYVARGLAYLVVDLPGQGSTKRLRELYMPPDTERLISDVIDYLETRPDVDASRIGLQTVSMGGYVGPRAASGEPRVKAVW